jgi:hypothetical protein
MCTVVDRRSRQRYNFECLGLSCLICRAVMTTRAATYWRANSVGVALVTSNCCAHELKYA